MAKTTTGKETPSRAPGSTGKGQERRQEILHASTELLIEEGYARFSTRQVAERLGLRLSNVQYYFPSRESLLEALLEGVLASATAELRRQRIENDLESLVRFVLDGQTPDACLLFLELWALAARDAGARQAVDRFYQAYSKEIEALIGESAPSMKPAERKRRATMVMALLEGVSLLRRHAEPTDKELQGALVRAVRCIVEQPV